MSIQNSEFFFNSGGDLYSYLIDGSLKFYRSGTSYLSRTQATSGNRDAYTISFWLKLTSNISTERYIISNTNGSNRGTHIRFNADNTFEFFDYPSGINGRLITSRVFRDVSSWYHFVLVYDSANATASERMRIYINGERELALSTATYPPQNTDGTFNSNAYGTISIGINTYAGNTPGDYYLSEVNFIDGLALTADSFGEFKSNVWIPKQYSGSYGTQGFYLKFAGNTNDSSGNGNNFTATNITANDYIADSQTNNFCTMNSVASPTFSTGVSFQEGNLQCYYNGAVLNGGIGTFRIPKTGKWYFEFSMNSASTSGFTMAGVISETIYSSFTNPATQRTGVYRTNGQRYNLEDQTAQSPNYSTYTTGDVIGVAVDNDNGYLYFAKNNVWQNSTNPSTGTADANMDHVPDYCYPVFYNDNNSSVKDYRFNFGQDSTFSGLKTSGSSNASDANGYGDFYYAPPTNFLALCTANLPEPATSPAEDSGPKDYFNTVLYTGNGSTQSITGVGFQPDMVWMKSRSSTYGHRLCDVIQGVTLSLRPDSTTAQAIESGVTSFNTDGFTLGSDIDMNNNGSTYVAWNWKANGAGVSNTAGSINSTVSANTDAGVSIVRYQGNNSSGSATVGHGLGQIPAMIIVKLLDNSSTWNAWVVGHQSLGWGDSSTVYLDDAVGKFDGYLTTPWNNTAPTSSVFSVASSAGAGINYLNANYNAYCFAEVDGFSAFGIWRGNSSSDGPYIYTGFRPAFIIYKGVSTGSRSWIMLDNTRNPYNVASARLLADGTSTESSGTHLVDFCANGFKLRNANSQGNIAEQYIYMAFAETPFKYANAR